MAEVLGISRSSLSRWCQRQTQPAAGAVRAGRPCVIPQSARDRLRKCYTGHYGQWGPQVLSAWACRIGLGKWSPETIAKVIADLKPVPLPKAPPERYEVTASGVMWSEDGAGFRDRGRKKELLVLQDECARFKVNHKLVKGPAKGEDVVSYLRAAFESQGPPLVLKHDGDKIFHDQQVQQLLDEYGVVGLTSPPGYPQYNGKKERSIRDIKSYERAMRRFGVKGSLAARLEETIDDLNDHRPRPVLGGRTAREVYESKRHQQNRGNFIREVRRKERILKEEAVSRRDRETAHRRAVEETLSVYKLIEKWGDVSTNKTGGMAT